MCKIDKLLKENNNLISRVENLRYALYKKYLDYTYDESVAKNYSKIVCIVLDNSNNSVYVTSLDTNSRINSDTIEYLIEIKCTYDSGDWLDKTDPDGNEKEGYLWNTDYEEWEDKEEAIKLAKESSFDEMWDNQIDELERENTI